MKERVSSSARSTQQEVAERVGTSHSSSRSWRAATTFRIPVLKRILAVIDEELLIGIERQIPDEVSMALGLSP